MNRNIRILTAPAVEPVSLEEAKTWCRVDADDQDTVLEMLIRAARERAEDITGRAFVLRELELRLDAFPDEAEITLPFAPLINVSAITYIDGDGAAQTLTGSPEQFKQDAPDDAPGRIRPLEGSSWPATRADTFAAVRIAYTCGYAPGSGSPTDYTANIPAVVKQWMQVRISTFYEMRESLVVGQTVNQPPRDYVDGLLDHLRVRFGFA